MLRTLFVFAILVPGFAAALLNRYTDGGGPSPGIGLRNYERMYDEYDTTGGKFGHQRAVHNSTMQVLAEAGFPGLVIWLSLFGVSLLRCGRILKWSNQAGLPDDQRRFFRNYSIALIVSITSFIVSGSFIALALNDLTWLTFALVAALDLLWKGAQASKALTAPVTVDLRSFWPTPAVMKPASQG